MKREEYILQARCFQWAQNTYGRQGAILIHAIPNEVVRHPGLLPGAADMVAVCSGRIVYIEMKTPSGTQSPAQKEFARRAIDQGAGYVVCRTYESFCEEIEKLILG